MPSNNPENEQEVVAPGTTAVDENNQTIQFTGGESSGTPANIADNSPAMNGTNTNAIKARLNDNTTVNQENIKSNSPTPLSNQPKPENTALKKDKELRDGQSYSLSPLSEPSTQTTGHVSQTPPLTRMSMNIQATQQYGQLPKQDNLEEDKQSTLSLTPQNLNQ